MQSNSGKSARQAATTAARAHAPRAPSPQACLIPRITPVADEDRRVDIRLLLQREALATAREAMPTCVLAFPEHSNVLLLASAVPQTLYKADKSASG